MKSLSLFLFILLFSCHSGNKDNTHVSNIPKDDTTEVATQKIDSTIIKAKSLGDSLCKVAGAINKPVADIDLEEINNKFTLRGAYINPKLIFLLMPWLNDDKPPILSIDIAAANVGTNQFFTIQAPYKNVSGSVILEEKDLKTNSIQYYSYEWLGMLCNKVHVLRCIESSSDGSGEFIRLLFVRFEIKKYHSNAKQYNQLVMENVTSYRLGDRVENTVKLEKNANQIKLTYKAFKDSTALPITKIIKP